MRYEDAKAVVDTQVAKIRAALKAGSEATDQEGLIAAVKLARVQAGQLYTSLGNDLKAAKAGTDPVAAREQAVQEKAAKLIAKAERKAALEAAREVTAPSAESEVAVG